MEIEDTERRAIEAAWEMGEYTKGECENCGRQRICFCQNGKHRCEKCNWVQEDKEYCEDPLN